MSTNAHRIYIGIFVSIVFATLILLINNGLPYYNSSIEERVFHSEHGILKPSGTIGHGLGIIGSLSIIIGVGTYIYGKEKVSVVIAAGFIKILARVSYFSLYPGAGTYTLSYLI